MIAIVDGGSTKCDWVILDKKGNVSLTTVTTGFNPNIINPELIVVELAKNPQLSDIKFKISHIFYYGSGCGIDKNKSIVQQEFAQFFTNAKVVVKEDLTAAAYAAYTGKPAIVCILGTGSNSCFFDGVSIRRDLPSLGFLIGDEGSGSAFGKLLLKKYFMKKLPLDLEQEFKAIHQLKIEDALHNMYHNPRANAYLGSFNQFIAERKQHPYFQNLIFEEIKNFLDYQVLPYPESHQVEINFIGFVAYIYEDIIRAAAADLNLHIGTIVRKPIESLVEYHINYLLSDVLD
ncbi:MAG: ATPase [Bacteroidetes bacterium]|nr:ATPase [Bacteroidota bacterium]